jgi:hypothetical protein
MSEPTFRNLLKAALGDARGEGPPSCPDSEALWAFALRRANRADHGRIVGHLGECGRCAALVARYARGAERLRQREPDLRRQIAAVVAPPPAGSPSRTGIGERWAALGRRPRARWAAAGMVVAAVLLVALLARAPWRESGDSAYEVAARAAQQDNLQVARAGLERDHPELFAGGAARFRFSSGGARRGESQPDGVAFLPGDRIAFRGERAADRGQRYQLLLDGHMLAPDLREPTFTAPAPPPGAHRWTMLTLEGDAAGEGRFLVLGEAARQVVARAERELAGKPLELAALYAVLGLETRARAQMERALPGLPPAQQEAVRRRFALPDRSPR